MQARLEMKRFPLTFVAVLIALALMLALGGTLGYALKPATVISGPTRVIVVPATQPAISNPADANCTVFGGHRMC